MDVGDEDDQDASGAGKRLSALRQRWEVAKRRLRWRLPWLFPHPDASYYLERDPEENAETRVRFDRELRGPAIWGVEVYGASEIEALYGGLDKLAWRRAGGFTEKDAASADIRRMRASGGGGWTNIGPVYAVGARKRSMMSPNIAPLPNGVASLMVRAFQLTPSLTALLVGFRFDGDGARAYEAEFQADRATVSERIEHGIQFHRPTNQKERAIEDLRRRRREMVGIWLAKHLPGYFSEAGDLDKFPTMELLTGVGLSISDTEKRLKSSARGWHRLLSQLSSYDAWTFEPPNGLEVAFHRVHRETLGQHILAYLDTRVFEPTPDGPRADPLHTHVWTCDDLLGGMLVHLATIEYLDVLRRSLEDVRSRMKRVRSSGKDVAKAIEEVSAHFDQMIGAPAIVRELAARSRLRARAWDFPELLSPIYPGQAKREPLWKGIRRSVYERATQLAEDEESLRGHFEQMTAILSVRESIRLQRRSFWASSAALVVATLSLLFAVPADSVAGQALRRWWTLLWGLTGLG